MIFELSQKFYFEAAHTLHREFEAEGSRRIHGHTYHVEVSITGIPDPKTGMIIDLGQLRKEIERVREALDHMFLDEISELGPATLENICVFIFRLMSPAIPCISSVMVERQASGDRCQIRREVATSK